MTEDYGELDKVALTRLRRVNATVQGVVLGIVAGLIVFVATNWLVIRGGEVVGPNLGLLDNFFLGYSVSFPGSLIGFGYGFAIGFLFGYLAARLYNWIADMRDRLA